MKCHPVADCYTDHVMVVAWVRLRLKKLNRTKRQLQREYSALRTEQIWHRYKDTVYKKLSEKTEETDEHYGAQSEYGKLRAVVKEAAEEILPKFATSKKQNWMTDEKYFS